ncbi:TIGR03943 family putative permease subunit [Actinokineospora soli]|uniref:TIGR03943 family putative permease subunit n=1 Tax=Actinokineospora soli TaxID=1048753 RepID=A0ABW2TIN9_9PSEU
MNRTAQSVVLVLIGAVFLRVGLTDQVLRYVREGLRPAVVAAGVLLLAMGAITLWHGRSGAHGHREPAVTWLLVLPVAALLVVTPQPLGAYAAGNAGTVLDSRAEFAPLPDGDPVRVTVLDYASRAVFDDGATLTGRRVLLTGFIARTSRGEPLLVRMILTCCAADGRPVKVALSGAVPDGIAPDTWVEVTGAHAPGSIADEVNGETIPYLRVDSVEVVPAPSRPYE